MSEPAAPPAAPAPSHGALPGWLAWPVAAVLGLLGGFSVGGVGLAMAGAFRPWPVALVTVGTGGLLVVGLWWGGAIALASGRGPGVWLPAAGAVALVVASSVWNVANRGEHLLVDRDPGVYVVTARWLSDEGTLRLAGGEGAFADEDDFRAAGAGFVPSTHGDHLYAQFPALFPAAMAVGRWVAGDDGLLAANAVLGGLALLALYAAATTITRPAWALAAVAAVAVNLVFVHFVRDAFSEPITMALLFGGLWAFALARRRPSLAGGAVAGLLVGASCLARVDAFVTLVPLAAVCGLEAVVAAAEPAGRRWRRRAFAAAVAIPAGAVAALAAVEVDRFSPAYSSALGDDYGAAIRAAVAVAAAGLVLAAAAPALLAAARRWHRLADTARAAWVAVAVLAGFALAAWLLASYAVRPSGVSLAARLPELAERGQYSVLTMRWLGWYLGPPVLAAAGVAWCLLVVAAAVGRRYRGAAAFVAVLSATSLLYLYRPRINPDQIWAMRRFLAVTVPGLYVAVAWLAGEVWARTRRWWSVLPRLAAVAGLVAVVAASAATVEPVPGERSHAGTLDAVERLCDRVGDDGAVLVARGDLMALAMPQTVRTFCGVPAAVPRAALGADDLVALAADWADEGRSLFVLASTDPTLDPLPATERLLVASLPLEALEHTALRRPDRVEVDRRVVKDEDGVLDLYLFPVTAETSTR
jgi:hypothetical protein